MNENISLKIENEKIVFADLTNREKLEAVIVCKSGNIYLFDFEKDEKSFLAMLSFDSVPNLINDFNSIEILQDLTPNELSELLKNQSEQVESIETITVKNSEFVNSLSLNTKLYSFQNYVCIVQQQGTLGVVLDLSNLNYRKILTRGDYGVGTCQFPIAFYSKDNQTFLIHGTDWNRLDITFLETDELLTERLVDYDTDSNYFDYFHSSLLISPDAKHFTSNGWHWHPYGQIYCFSIERFLREFELSNKSVDVSEEDYYDLDWDRPLCWIDNQTLAICFNQQVCSEKKDKYPNEILFFDINQNKIIKRINFDGFGLTFEGNVYGDLFYDSGNKQFIGLNKKTGLLISDIDGNELFRDPALTAVKYSEKHKLFYNFDIQTQTIEFKKKWQ
jgi:hypothetical protein